MKTILQKSLILVLAIGLSTQLAQAQKFIPKVGINVSAIDAKLNDFDAEVRTGWNAGFDLRYGEGFVFFNPGLHYYNFSAELTDGFDVDDPTQMFEDERTMIRSIRLPLNVGFNLLGNNKILGVHVKGGVTPGYVIGVKETDSYSLDVEDLKRFTTSANVGAGVDFLIFTADLTYEIGLNDFFENAEGKNNMLTLGLGLKF